MLQFLSKPLLNYSCFSQSLHPTPPKLCFVSPPQSISYGVHTSLRKLPHSLFIPATPLEKQSYFIPSKAQKNLCSERKHLCSERKHLCSGRKHLCSGQKHLCSERKYLCSGRKHLCSERKYLCFERKHLCFERKYLCSERKYLCSERKYLCVTVALAK